MSVALVATSVAVVVTLRADFLAHPAWLAVQKADFILGPVVVGLYWRRRRPDNPLGALLVVLGLVSIPYILESSADPALFAIGTVWEAPIHVMTTVVILAFCSGRLDGPAERLIIAAVVLSVALPEVLGLLARPDLAPSLPLSGCRTTCPANELAVWSAPAWTTGVNGLASVGLIAISIATAVLLVWRFVTGTPPRRRALAIGLSVALPFLAMQATYGTIVLLSPGEQPVASWAQWTFAGARSLVWYGFLIALVGAELVAAHALRALVRGSLGRPSLGELEELVRTPLGDPGLRLGFWRSRTQEWVGVDGAVLRPPGPQQAMTEVRRDRQRAAAIVHDRQLDEDPELVQAAGTVALLALENAELDAACRRSLRELAGVRARLVGAADRERRRLERDLHDGAQQRLVAASINLSVADELADGNSDLRQRVTEATQEVVGALTELRELAHGIYPPALGQGGLGHAFDLLAARHPGLVAVSQNGVGRFRPEVEAAMYYCCREAVQNAFKHAGRDAHLSIRLYTDDEQLHLEVRDNGPGFDISRPRHGVGLQNMRDRLGAVGGRAEIVSRRGEGTLVAAVVPVGRRSTVAGPA